MTHGDPQTHDPREGSGASGVRRLLERFLGLFADVQPGEGTNIVLMFANIFLILSAYYVLKVVREGLTIGGVQLFGMGGDEIKAYLPALMALLLLGVVPAYGALASRVSRVRLLNTTTLFVMVTLVLFWLWGSAVGVGTAIGLSFYVYLGIVNVFLIAQFWSFANDIYSEPQGKRLFAIIALGQSLGAVLGPKIAAYGADRIFLLLVVSAGIFGVCLLLYNVVNRRDLARASSAEAGAASAAQEPLQKGGGFQLVFQNRYLLLIALMILITNVVNTTGEYILSHAAKSHAEEQVPALDAELTRQAQAEAEQAVREGEASGLEEALATASDRKLRGARSEVIGRFYGDFFFWVNLAGLVIQMFFVSRIFKYFGVRAALFVLPVISFGGYAAIGLLGGLAAGQDRRERDRLLAPEHGQAGALPAHQPGGQVQGQGGHRYVFRALRGCSLRRHRGRGPPCPALRSPRVRLRERGARAGVGPAQRGNRARAQEDGPRRSSGDSGAQLGLRASRSLRFNEGVGGFSNALCRADRLFPEGSGMTAVVSSRPVDSTILKHQTHARNGWIEASGGSEELPSKGRAHRFGGGALQEGHRG